MALSNPYFRLMRLDKPVGYWLCYWPAAWAILFASPSNPQWSSLALFLIEAIILRSAGCIVNDMADHEFDRQVERTKARPLASGELTMRNALHLLIFLLFLALLPLAGMYVWLTEIHFFAMLLTGFPLLLLTVAYPFMKRITWWPQAFLGLTFNWGVWIGWIALCGQPEWPALLLYIGAFFWTLGYDTVYGFQDMQDDEKIGVKSTSQRLASHPKRWLTCFYSCTVIFLAVAVWLSGLIHLGWYGLLFMALHFTWQIVRLNIDNPRLCLTLFKSNAWLGGLWLIPLLLNYARL